MFDISLAAPQILFFAGVLFFGFLTVTHILNFVFSREAYDTDTKVGYLLSFALVACLLIISHHLVSEARYEKLFNQQKQIMTELQNQ